MLDNIRNLSNAAVTSSTVCRSFSVPELLSARRDPRPKSPMRQIFAIGNRFQSKLVGTVRSSADMDCRSAATSMIGMAEPLVELLAPAFPSWMAIQYQEFNNRIFVFDLVRNARRHVWFCDEDKLPAFVKAAYACNPFETLWLVEGIGYYFTRSRLQQDGSLAPLLDKAEVRRIPKESLSMLHAGLGMAFAEAMVESISDNTSFHDLSDAVRKFSQQCGRNSSVAYLGAAYESLGLIVQMFRPRVVRNVDCVLLQIVCRFRAFYWHGVGRCNYLMPRKGLLSNFSKLYDEISDETAQKNQVAGLFWAATLVNMRQPHLFAAFVHRQGLKSSLYGAAGWGVATALAIRRTTTPSSNLVRAFREYFEDPKNETNSVHIREWCRNDDLMNCKSGLGESPGELFRAPTQDETKLKPIF